MGDEARMRRDGRGRAARGPARKPTSRPAPRPRRAPINSRVRNRTWGSGAREGWNSQLKRTSYGLPSIGARLAKRASGTRRERVIGSTLKHNSSLGYISRGYHVGNRRKRAVRSRVIHMLPRIALAVILVACVGGIGYAVQGGWNPVAALFGPAESAPVGTLTQSFREHAATPVAQARLTAESPDAVVLDPGRVTASGTGHVTFSAVGDNLANENILELARTTDEEGNEVYDFAPFYQDIKPTIASYDVAFVNQETTLGGPDRYGYNGYPSYNTPDSMADAVADVGWRVVSTNTNHTYDTWTPSIEHAHEVWSAKSDQLLTIGSYASEDDRERPRVVECNGVRIAFLSYCYGQNGYEQSELPNDYYAVPYDEDAMKADVERARRAADAVVVYMHWGTEYTHEPSEEQRTWAAQLADAGVDLVIGSHAHVIQPMEWVEGAGGKTLVVYGLGDFLSGYHNKPETILSGMFTCEFVRTEAKEEGDAPARRVELRDPTWHPLIEHWANGSDSVRLVKGYTDEEARANELLSGLDDPLTWIKTTTTDVIGEDFTIDM